MKKIIPFVFAIILFVSAIAHVLAPSAYAPMIPDFIPEWPANIFTAVVEAFVGLLLLSSKYRALGGIGFSLLMIGFMPLHIWDLLRDDPMITPYVAAIVRVIVQVLLILAGWRIYKKNKRF